MDELKQKAEQQLQKAWQAARQGGPYTEQQEQDIIQAARLFTGNLPSVEQAEDILRNLGKKDIELMYQNLTVKMPPGWTEAVQKMYDNLAKASKPIQEAMQEAQAKLSINAVSFVAQQEALQQSLQSLRETFAQYLENNPRAALYAEIRRDLEPYIEAELEKPKYNGATIAELFDSAESDGDSDDSLPAETSLLMQAVNAARKAKERAEAIEAQNAGRAQRRQLRENAESKGAIMELQNDGALPVFSEKVLWDAFAPGRIAQMGKLAPDAINEKTGKVEKKTLEKGDIVPLPAANISYKAFMLLNAIMANSVENYREYLVSDGALRFYVKGVLDQLEISARISGDPQQIELDRHTLNRKTAGALYLEEQLKPLLLFVGTTPNGSRYSVLNYEGYDIESDTMTIRSPYLFQLWKGTQGSYAKRQKAKAQRIAEGKKPLKADLKPLELNTLFKRSAYKEDDTVLEIATYITNVLLNAGKGAHKTRIKYRTLINSCPRLYERLEEIENQPKTADGKRINTTAHCNSALRKIARAYTLIMSPEKCDLLKHFEIKEFSPTKPGKGYKLPIKEKDGKAGVDWHRMEFTPPTKSTLNGEIFIEWRRIDPDNA